MNTLGGKPYVEALKRSLLWLLGFSVALAVLAWAVASTIKPSHQVYFSYLVSLAEREPAEEFRFDGYYAIQATDLFAATLAKWIGTPEVISAAYEAAEIEEIGSDPRQLVRAVHAEKTAPQLVEVVVQHKNPDTAKKLASGLMSVMDRNIDQYHDQGIPALQFRVVTTEPWQGATSISRGVIAVATFVLVLFLGINIVLLIEATKQSSGQERPAGRTW
ncbi:MAG: hypothetical protein HYR90_02755 [Candidatus Andersenbacteria bacterium]|nr:hypothetical protein [Candidatus Andersenbacteria bacterium]MBI3251077.1 hypothetical protein [Candidatus Andersenbacteria bacterium]